MIASEVINELRYMAEVYRESADEWSEEIDDQGQADENALDASYLESAAAKLERGEPLSDNERDVVVAELNDWSDKDRWSVQPDKRKLLVALAELGDLEPWDDSVIVMGPKGKKWKYGGKVYRVW
jgi:hypothetical protein